jgi:hypothetical protein
MAVEIETEPTFKRGNPNILFKGIYYSSQLPKGRTTPWDISPDGKKFLMIKPSGVPAGGPTAEKLATATTRPKINIVLNWFEELKQRVPVK